MVTHLPIADFDGGERPWRRGRLDEPMSVGAIGLGLEYLILVMVWFGSISIRFVS